jgi:uncharacterized protein (DUF983 family)
MVLRTCLCCLILQYCVLDFFGIDQLAMADRTYLEGIILGKCPRCREGDMFAYPATNLLRFNKMNEECPHCHVRLEPEPGFYQGAMYVSYGFTILVMIIISFILYYLAGNPADWVYIAVMIGVMIVLVPINFRYSRILFLYLFGGIKYDPRLSK